MLIPEKELTDNQLGFYYQLAELVHPPMLGRTFDSFMPSEIAQEIGLNQHGAESRIVTTSYDPSVEPLTVTTVNDAIIRLAPKLLDFATRNRLTVGVMKDLGHVIGLRKIEVVNYSGLGVALWSPATFRTEPFTAWVPHFGTGQ